ncbi:uncharacterized protein LOC115241632 [Formica exsecta]|uniref:uncharacterized protein LOC115241632 n=1 Tax=Formica exsecta TaxID=72781 RepID=UPI001141BEB5|nr:uncharacterized protein LOC115241632 [Formica exsecta]
MYRLLISFAPVSVIRSLQSLDDTNALSFPGNIRKDRTEKLRGDMRFQSPMIFLLCAVSLAIARQVEDCQKDVDDDELIWEYDVRRPHRTGGYQEVEADYGPTDVRITCIRYNSLSDEDNSAIWITSGGIGHDFVKLKFRSKYSRGLHYRVFVYGQPTLKRSSLS